VREAALDAELLLRHVLGWDRAKLFANPDHRVPESDHDRFLALVRRRAAREPLQYIVGSQAFWKHEFLVTPAVLIPRPETELLVETSLELLRDVERPLVVDVGTGSGCIALSLAAERPDAIVHATDISEPALAVARENSRRLGLEGRVTFHRGDLLEPVRHLAGTIDLVVSNPPYVDASEIDGLDSEVRDHDPRVALVPPSGDRYEIYRRLAVEGITLIRQGGWVTAEVGHGMAATALSLFSALGWSETAASHDLQRVARILRARLQAQPAAAEST
jgi:release factor glutamine methyltransferase